MNKYDISEYSYKNGYNAGIREFAKQLCELCEIDGKIGSFEIQELLRNIEKE